MRERLAFRLSVVRVFPYGGRLLGATVVLQILSGLMPVAFIVATSLDAHAEHVLFERYAESARSVARATGGIAIVVSHRFSTIRMADLIAVVDGGRVVEQGTHERLVARGGVYAELFALQAAAYSS